MIPLPEPRGFWDYGLFALLLTGGLVFLLGLRVNGRVRWADIAFAITAAVLFVLATILARQGEKAVWIVRPTWRMYLLLTLGALLLVYGAIFADLVIFHPRDVSISRIETLVVAGIMTLATSLWSLGRRNIKGR
jgi:drug/metabolite transporter (DMT)-like permease